MEWSSGHAVHGRAAELARLARFLDEVTGHPAALLLEGEPGIGKTTLWSAGIDQARGRGWQVLTCRPVQSEAALSFSALGDLLEPVPEAALGALPGPQRRALDVALLRAEPGPEPPDQRAVAVAFLGVIRALAQAAPVIVGVDDLPWLDRSSAAVLEYTLRRLTTQPAGLLATAATADQPSLAPLVQRWFPPGHLDAMTVGPLSAEALDTVLRAKGGPPGSWPEVVEVHEASGGNPYFAMELAAAMGAQGHRRGARQPLPVPGSLLPLVQRRLAALTPAGGQVALVAAAAAAPTVEVVLAACGDDQDARDGLESAEAAGVLQIAGDRVRFAHPLLRSAHYSSATRQRRQQAHRRLAAVTGAAEGQVRHLALAAAGPDGHLAARLAAAAEDACLRGAAVAGAELADLALRLTPDHQPAARAGRLTDAGRLHLAAFDPEGARELLDQAIGLTGPGPLRAAALHHRARVAAYLEGTAAATPLIRQALAEAEPGTALSALIHRDLGFLLGVSTENFTAEPVEHFLTAFDTAERLGDQGLISQLSAFRALAGFVIGHGIDRDLIGRAVAAHQQAARVPMELRPRVIASHVLRSGDDLAGARELLSAEYAEAIEQGAETDLPFVAMPIAELEAWAGNYARAEEYADHGYRVALAAGAVTGTACMHGARAMIRAFRGPLGEARAEAGAAIDEGLRSGVYYPALLGSHALGLAALAAGDPAAAHAILGLVTAATAGREMVDPGWLALRPLPDDIESLIRLGDLAAAEALLASLEERAQRLDRAWALASAGRCRALLMSARGDQEAASAALRQAFAAHERLAMPAELARTHLAAGEVARRARRKVAARDHVTAALGLFTRLGAAPWAERAAAELARLGTSRGGGSGLTEAERQVAGLVAAGHTNREVAAELYMGLRTVEAHLSAIYRKLGIRSRSELARTWGGQPPLADRD
ncbi:MAG TPA: LuxR family transcriptional regulator [Streptosporangiaceae bacterium]|jgi:DNA-binding CsgD family transcriptional regulator|nr:LuxR family transcriptional regulator [Streptosporangiaceae bacterium]